MHILDSILQIKSNHLMKFGQLKDYNKRIVS